MDLCTQRVWIERVIRAVEAALPPVEHISWPAWEQVLKQALVCEQWAREYHLHFPEVARLLRQTGWYLTERARYSEAKPLLEFALAISEQEQGDEHPGTAASLDNLARLYKTQGKYEQAEPLYQRALAIYEQQMGPQHPDTATSLNNLAGLYKAQGEYEQAESLCQQALAIYTQQLGPQHPHIASCFNNLAGLYQVQGEYEQAKPLYERALAIREQHLGSQHPSTAKTKKSYHSLLPRDAQRGVLSAKGASQARSMLVLLLARDQKYRCLSDVNR